MVASSEEFQFTRPRRARPGRRGEETVPGTVSIHAPAKGATSVATRDNLPVAFQFTRPRRARREADSGNHADDEFQFTRPRRARPWKRGAAFLMPGFNSRAREGRDRPRRARPELRRRFQFTRPRRARPLVPARVAVRDVSIHAPAKGATQEHSRQARFDRFQFTRPRRARLPVGDLRGHGKRFNSRAREGRDHRPAAPARAQRRFNSRAREGRDGESEVRPMAADVSIHAPAKGATMCMPSISSRRAQFQFTRPRRARRRPSASRRTSHGFNSRAREGRDGHVVRVAGPAAVSIHAPAKGATRPRGGGAGVRDVSIHAPAKGATGGDAPRPGGAVVSIHAPAKGATSASSRPASAPHQFQFTRPRRARRTRRRGGWARSRFNSRAREGRDRRWRRDRPAARSFNSRAREGRDARPAPASPGSRCFNSRAREGRDRFVCWMAGRQIGFNSRAREGRDADVASTIGLGRVSIHAPAKGATTGGESNGNARVKFQFTRPRRARPRETPLFRWFPRFQFTRPRRARPRCTSRVAGTCGFNSRAREGRDQPLAGLEDGRQGFNSRAREGRDFQSEGKSVAADVSIHAPAKGATEESLS